MGTPNREIQCLTRFCAHLLVEVSVSGFVSGRLVVRSTIVNKYLYLFKGLLWGTWSKRHEGTVIVDSGALM